MRTYNFIIKVNAVRILQRFRRRYTKDMRQQMRVSPWLELLSWSQIQLSSIDLQLHPYFYRRR